ncbi:MAG: hypothetical protein KGL39_33405 [Patescibacteria group bacterium]|nr:hypothetical protein [Patescibacteria group bacterium]
MANVQYATQKELNKAISEVSTSRHNSGIKVQSILISAAYMFYQNSANAEGFSRLVNSLKDVKDVNAAKAWISRNLPVAYSSAKSVYQLDTAKNNKSQFPFNGQLQSEAKAEYVGQVIAHLETQPSWMEKSPRAEKEKKVFDLREYALKAVLKLTNEGEKEFADLFQQLLTQYLAQAESGVSLDMTVVEGGAAQTAEIARLIKAA